MPEKPMVLMILDGWGQRCASEDNAISCANPANFQALQNQYPHTLLECSGYAVGLPRGQMGNSEVGHLNIGAGRVVYQEITRICQAIEDGTFFIERREKHSRAIWSRACLSRSVSSRTIGKPAQTVPKKAAGDFR